MEEVSRTALVVAAHRAAESARADALFVDPWAGALAGAGGRADAIELASATGFTPTAEGPSMFAVRTRFYDDALLGAAGSAGAGAVQVVILAAGMDTRAFRLGWPAGTVVFELDRPGVVERKDAVLADAGARARCDRRVVATDLRTDWIGALVDRGFDPDGPTVWSAEGVLYYLSDADVDRCLDHIGRASAPGSTLVTDVHACAMRDLPQLAEWRAVLEAWGEPIRSVTDDGPGLLRAHGWEVTTATSIAEVAERLGHDLPAVGSLGARRLLVARRR